MLRLEETRETKVWCDEEEEGLMGTDYRTVPTNSSAFWCRLQTQHNTNTLAFLRKTTQSQAGLGLFSSWWEVTAPKGYVCLVNHALAESEVGVRQVGQSLQENLGGHLSLEVGWVKLVPAGRLND